MDQLREGNDYSWVGEHTRRGGGRLDRMWPFIQYFWPLAISSGVSKGYGVQVRWKDGSRGTRDQL